MNTNTDTRNPFTPVGETARWRVIYDLLRDADYGEIVTYDTLAHALDTPAPRNAIQQAAARAAKELLLVDDRAIESVRNQGYRIVHPEEHLRLAQNRQTRASRQLVKGRNTVEHVDLNRVDPEVRKALDVTARAFATLLDYNKRLDTRQARLEKNLASMSTKQDRTVDELEKIKERLARIETCK